MKRKKTGHQFMFITSPPPKKKKRNRDATHKGNRRESGESSKVRQTNKQQQRQTVSTQIKVSLQNNAMQFVKWGKRPPRAYRRRSFVLFSQIFSFFFFFSFFDPMGGFEVESRCCALNGRDCHSFPLGPFGNSIPL